MDFEVLRTITQNRQTIRSFSKQSIPPGVLETILGYSLRTPTSNNLQPYKMILVRDDAMKEPLSVCMSKKNAPVVMEAPVSIIVCSDVDSRRCVSDYGHFAYKENWREKTRAVSIYTSVKYTLNTLTNVLFGWVFDLVGSVIRLFRPFTARITMQSWSQQQAAFLIENICLLAESVGVSSAIMNGFSEDALRETFHIPKRYQVAAVVALGYKKEEDHPKRKSRFPFENVVFDGLWMRPFASACLCLFLTVIVRVCFHTNERRKEGIP